MTEDIPALREALDSKLPALEASSQAKEAIFQKRQTLRDEITTLIRQIKELKHERNKYTDVVKTLKNAKRDGISKQKVLLKDLKELQSKIKDVRQAGNTSPDQLSRQIEKLEYIIETEALSPPKEKDMMTKIKQLKKEYDQLAGTQDIFAKYRDLRATFTIANKEINLVKKQIQDEADKSQQKHEEMIAYSQKVDELKAAIDDLDTQYDEKREAFVAIAQEVKEIKQKLGIAIPEKKRVDITKRKEETERKRAEDRKEIETLQKEVMEKVKTKKKFTTEDLLILQSREDDDDINDIASNLK